MGLFTFRSQYVFLNTQPPIGLEEALDKIPEARGYETLALPHESATTLTKKIFLELKEPCLEMKTTNTGYYRQT